MNNNLKLLHVVALLRNIPEKNLLKGQLGTIVEIHDSNVFEIEFSNKKGETLTMLLLKSDELLALHY